MRFLKCNLLGIISILALHGNVFAAPFVRVSELQDLNSTSIFKIEQNEKNDVIISSKEGVFSYDGYHLHLLMKVVEPDYIPSQKSYTDKDGRTYTASGHGLIMTSADGKTVEEIPLDTQTGLPVTCIFSDRDSNIWVGTYYNGLFFCGINSECISFAHTPSNLKNIRSLIADKHSRIWAFTDNSGIFFYSAKDGKWGEHPMGRGIKFQNACYNNDRDEIWAYDVESGLVHLRCRDGQITRHKLKGSLLDYSYAMMQSGNKLYMGGQKGLCIIDTDGYDLTGKAVTGIDKMVYDIIEDKDGRIWIASLGIYTLEGDSAVRADHEKKLSRSICHDIDFDSDGALWIAILGSGFAKYQNGEVTYFNNENTGLPSNSVNTVTCDRDGKIVLGHSSGLSIYDKSSNTIRNYGKNIGVPGNSTSGRSSILLDDGSVWIGNSGGITICTPTKSCTNSKSSPLNIDRVLLDGADITQTDGWFNLNYRKNRLSIYLSDYDYENIFPCRYEYFSNENSNPILFDITSPLSLNEISPGKHEITIRRTDVNTGLQFDTAVKINVIPEWYATTAAKVSYILAAALIVFFMIRSRYAKRLLQEKLRLSEMENEKSVKFYVDLSYKVRTPINATIGILEKFFKDFGNRTAGVEQLEEVFYNSIQVRDSLNAHINSQETILEQSHPYTEAIRTKARFLNAATGAIERRIFSGEQVNVGILCKELNMGKTQMTALIEEAAGMTPRQFIEDTKLKHSYRLLKEGRVRVNETAAMMGFSSPGYFSLKFKQKYGISPSECWAKEKGKLPD